MNDYLGFTTPEDQREADEYRRSTAEREMRARRLLLKKDRSESCDIIVLKVGDLTIRPNITWEQFDDPDFDIYQCLGCCIAYACRDLSGAD